MRRLISAVLLVAACANMIAQNDSDIEAILAMTGAAGLEELDEYEYERLSRYLLHPLKLNQMSASRLAASGLMTPYQAASLVDYRLRHGDVMSFNELASVDGFSAGLVARLEPFVSLQGGLAAVQGKHDAVNDLSIRFGMKSSADEYLPWIYGFKYGIETSRGISAGVAASKSQSAVSGFPDAFSASFEWEPVRLPARVLVGDFNARFGQGLVLYNGMSMSGLASPSTFLRRSSGYSRTDSFTGTYAMTGVAGTLSLKHLSVNASVALPGIKEPDRAGKSLIILPALNLTWNHRHGHVGLTDYILMSEGTGDMKSSLDMAFCLKGIDVFSEIAFDWKNMIPAGLAGCVFPMSEYLRSGIMLRAYPSDFSSEMSGAQRSTTKCSNEYSVTFATEFLSPSRSHSARFSADAAYFPEPKAKGYTDNRQLKIIADYSGTFGDLTFKARVSERIRDWGIPSRTDIRADLKWERGEWLVDTRVNLLHCIALSGLSYIEGAYKVDEFAAFLKSGLFWVDNWDDRIYVYERDVPGTFNVPAMYGRGLWSSAYVRWQPSGWLKICASASFTSYLFMEEDKRKPGRAGLRLQCMLSF